MRILVFAPHSEIWVHAFPEALITDALRGCGHEVSYVTCGGALSDYCVPMSSHSLTVESSAEDRLQVCGSCKANASVLTRAFNFEGSSIASHLTIQDRAEVDALVAKTSTEALEVLSFDGIPVGKIALYQTVLQSKKFDANFEPAEQNQYRIDVRHALYAVRVAKKIFDQWRPERVLVYNGLYTINRAFSLFAESRGVPAYFMHAGMNVSRRLQTIMLGRGQTYSYLPHVKAQWQRFARTPCSAKELGRVTDHMVELLKGRSIFVYSAGNTGGYFDAKEYFGVKSNQKLIIASLSSPDEYAAGARVGALEQYGGLLFNSQLEWVSSLIEFASARPDIFLVIRVHPREFPNRRDRKMSQHALELQAAFKTLPDNAAVNWPDQNISIYDLADQTDVFLNAWSSVGREMPIFGIPVVSYSSQLPWYAAELNYVGETLDTYFSSIDEALRDGWNFERSRLAYRWMVHEFVRSTIDISDSYSEIERPDRSIAQRIYHRVMKAISPTYIQKRDIRSRSPQLKAAAQICKFIESEATTILEQIPVTPAAGTSFEEEERSLRIEHRRLAELLFMSPAARAKSRLYRNLATPGYGNGDMRVGGGG